ncbi:MAG: hypothetical protein U0835_14570 [Isosphaeraceae bacterium]
MTVAFRSGSRRRKASEIGSTIRSNFRRAFASRSPATRSERLFRYSEKKAVSSGPSGAARSHATSRVDAHEARLAEHAPEHPADVELPRVSRLVRQSPKFGGEDGELDVGRPGEEHVVERVGFEDRDLPPGSRDPGEVTEGFDRVGKAVKALGAPGDVKLAFEWQTFDG